MQYPFSLSAPLSGDHTLTARRGTGVTAGAYDSAYASAYASAYDSVGVDADLLGALLRPVQLLLGGLDTLVHRAVCNIRTHGDGGADMGGRGGGSGGGGKGGRKDLYVPADAKSVVAVAPHVLLLHALSRIEYVVTGGSLDVSHVYAALQSTLHTFVSAYLKGVHLKRQKDAQKAALYRNRATERTFESNEAKEEEAALAHHFPDHLRVFRDMKGVMSPADLNDQEGGGLEGG
ncbi:hypothetical protein B484DRAFT_415280, partial [Ochromonadaceae sp. CCMP2298]